jgi:TonB family C-terminal domain
MPAVLLSILLCTLVFAQNSSDAELHFTRGETYLRSNQFSDAIKEFQQAVAINPKWPDAYFKLGVAYSGVPLTNGDSGENLKKALKAFEKAVGLRPEWPEALTELGSKYTTFLQYDKAIGSLKKAITLNSELEAAHENLAIAYLYIGHYTEAVGELQEAIRINPRLPRPHKLLGLAHLILDEREKALAQYQILQPLDPEMAKYLNNAIQSGSKPTFGVATGKLISVPKPEYPAAAKSNRISGSVTVEVEIDEQGKVVSARSLNGPIELRSVAEGAAMKARFTATKLSGQGVTVKGVITFNFSPQ